MIIIDSCEQGTPEWLAFKLGVPSSTGFKRIVTTKGEPSKSRAGYLKELALETVTGKRKKTFVSGAMAEGTAREDESRALYELRTGYTVRQVAVVFPDEQRKCLCSPDGLVLSADQPSMIQIADRGLEAKNPEEDTHYDVLMAGVLPTTHFCQVQGSLYVTGFDSWDYISYHPDLAPLIITVKRDEKFISKLASALDIFCLELALTVKKLRGG